MPLFKIFQGKANLLKSFGFSEEKKLQFFVEKNLELIFGLRFVQTEFPVHGFRLDTVALDE
jgi:hypothetical protein